MILKSLLVFLFFFVITPELQSHDGHKTLAKENSEQAKSNEAIPNSETQHKNALYHDLMHWLGEFHPIALHFPIALIIMTVIAEIFFLWNSNPVFDHAARFMIMAAAITAVPTALLGLAWSEDIVYTGSVSEYLAWHRISGLLTPFLAILATLLRELRAVRSYYVCLIIVFIVVNIASYLGGAMTFGPTKILPPL